MTTAPNPPVQFVLPQGAFQMAPPAGAPAAAPPPPPAPAGQGGQQHVSLDQGTFNALIRQGLLAPDQGGEGASTDAAKGSGSDGDGKTAAAATQDKGKAGDGAEDPPEVAAVKAQFDQYRTTSTAKITALTERILSALPEHIKVAVDKAATGADGKVDPFRRVDALEFALQLNASASSPNTKQPAVAAGVSTTRAATGATVSPTGQAGGGGHSDPGTLDSVRARLKSKVQAL